MKMDILVDYNLKTLEKVPLLLLSSDAIPTTLYLAPLTSHWGHIYESL